MKKSYLIVLAILILGVFLGFSNSDNPNGSKTNLTSKNKSTPIITDNNNPNSTAVDYYSDDFDAPNDTAALRSRGYNVYRNGQASGTDPSLWFTGFPDRFPAFNGDPDDYVAANSQGGGFFGNIDNWLVLPNLDVVNGDSLCFYSRSPTGSTKPDSIRVMYNPTNNTLPSDPNWIELGRFKVNTTGVWELRSFVIPSSALSARLAIRYSVVNAGVFNPNSDYIGIDALRVQGQGVWPVELASFVSIISNNNVTLNWTTATEINNSGFDIERRDARSETQDVWSMIGFVQGNGTTNSSINYSFTDRNLNSGNYNYRLKQIDLNGNFEYFNLRNEVVIGVPVKFELSQNYPNPFNPSTKIDYQLPNDGNVSISVFDNSGKEIMTLVNEFKTAGYYTINLNASSLSSGVYFYKISSDNFSNVKKMMLVK